MTRKPKTIRITVTNGIRGQPISVVNRSNGDEIHTTLSKAKYGVVDLQNFENNYTDGDVIDIIVAGVKNGSATLTTAGDGTQSVSISTSAINDNARGI